MSIWSWTAGFGDDYIALFAYYMASPLNILAWLAPCAWLREMLTLALLIKIGCAGLFTALLLSRTFKKGSLQAGQNGLVAVVFSSLYALCAFTLGYYYNIIWFDSFALLPLVMLGFLSLMNEGKFRLYVISLALAVLSNFYIGFFVCVITAIAFFCYCIIQKLNVKDFLLKFRSIAFYTVIAMGITAVLTIPAFYALQSTYSNNAEFPSILFLYRSFSDVLGNFIAFSLPTNIYGPPNLYCGMISIILTGVYFASSKISLREKIASGSTIFFLLLCCNVNVLDYIIHGFHSTNMIPYRFSFLISFILVVMAYRAFFLMEKIGRREIVAMIISTACVLLAAVLGVQEKREIIGSVILSIVYIALLYALFAIKTKKRKIILHVVFCLVIIIELSVTAWIAVNTSGTTDRSRYPDSPVQIKTLLNKRESADNDFYRTEIVPFYSQNDSSLYGYDGISLFSSTLNDSVTLFMRGIGMISGGVTHNFIDYNVTTPVSNAFLSIRYIITDDSVPLERDIYWDIAGKAGKLLLLENYYHLPLGFMVNNELASYSHDANNSFLSQNDLFCRSTGLDGDLFQITDFATNMNELPLRYKMPHYGMLFIYSKIDQRDRVAVFVNGVFSSYIDLFTDLILVVGRFQHGATISFVTERDDTQISIGYFNSSLFRQGYNLLADEPLILTHFSETKVCGTVNALKDGILYTSIPGKNWNVYVDGVKKELLLIDNAMAAVRLNKGGHEIEFRYVNKSFIAGVIVSIVSLAVFIALILLGNAKRKKLAN